MSTSKNRALLVRWLLFWSMTSGVHSTYWTYTSNCVTRATTYTFASGTTTVRSGVLPLSSDVTPTGTPVSTSSTTHLFWDLTLLYVIYDSADVRPGDVSTWESLAATATQIFTRYVQPTVYTAPATCPTPFTVSTSTIIDVPTQFTASYTPTSIKSADQYGFVTAFLKQGDITIPLPTSYRVAQMLAACQNPTAAGAADWKPNSTAEPVSSPGSDGNTGFRSWLIVVAVLIPLIFILGFLESFFWFRRLMMGKSALRGATVCWAILIIFAVRLMHRQPARSARDKSTLSQKWKSMSLGRRLKLWRKWGFRHAYPVEILGDPQGTEVSIPDMTESRIPGTGAGGISGASTARQNEQESDDIYPGPLVDPPPPYSPRSKEVSDD